MRKMNMMIYFENEQDKLRISYKLKMLVRAAIEATLDYEQYGNASEVSVTFTDNEGKVYTLEKVAVRGGRIAPPDPTAVEIMELHCRADKAEAERDALRERVRVLEGIFDTNSLNFLIK